MPWDWDIFIPLDLTDPRNADRLDPGGDRIRLRLNREGGGVVDFVVQYETPIEAVDRSHDVVLRSDGSHSPHVDLFDAVGNEDRTWLPAHLTPVETIQVTIDEIRQNWRTHRDRYFGRPR